MSERIQNWYKRFKKSFGPGLYIETDNPTEGVGGKDAFRLFSSTNKGEKFTLGMKGDGKVQMNADVSIEMVAGAKNNPKGTDILIHSRNGTIDIAVNKNGAVRIRGDNIQLNASNLIKLSSREIRMEASDEISLQAPKVWSRGKKGNLVPKTWMQSITAGSFIGADSIGSFLEKGLQEAAGIVDGIDDLAPQLGGLAGQAGELAKGLGDQLPGMQDQLKGIAGDLAPQLESFATSDAVTNLGSSLQGSIGGIGDALKSNSGAFANFGKGLVPTGY
tara:strand:+ start:250 stop:1074 length:825 start_codon:yes stop_codon:yes gene_type:complete